MIMFPCSHHACICSTVLSSWTSGLRCKGNWHKNKNMFQQTCISMNEMTTGSLKNISANMQHVFTFCDNGPWWIYPSAWDQWKCQFLQHHQTWRCDTATLQSSEIPHMQITTFSKRSASKTCHLFKFIIANISSQKSEFDFSRTMFANKIVSFTISSISKSPTMVSLLSSLVKDIRCETNFKPFQIVPVLFPPKFDKHTFDKQRPHKN